MGKINLNHWFVNDNKLSISLMNFYVSISIQEINQTIFFQLRVVDDINIESIFNFDTLEEAIYFTENVVNNCTNEAEIKDTYEDMYEENNLGIVADINSTDAKIELTPNEVDQAIIDYFSTEKSHKVSVNEELTIRDNKPDIIFYLIEHVNDNEIDNIKTILSEEDLKSALNDYVAIYNYEVMDFKYIGGIHKVGYFIDNETPYYDGIKLFVKKREKQKIRK